MTESSRLLSLDALRGATIAAMIVVNTPGTWNAIYPPLEHASWHGLTPTDLVFPFFLFIVGVSIALAYTKQLADGVPIGKLHRRILIRTAKIFLVGLFLNLWPGFDFVEIRVAGVLQRIALVFGGASILFLHLRWRALLGVTVAILVGYWATFTFVAVPLDDVNAKALATGQITRAHGSIVEVNITVHDNDSLAPNLEPGTNLEAWLDRRILPGAFYETTWDPEGWLSTLPAIATALLGLLTGLYLISHPERINRQRFLAGTGIVLLAVGYAWGLSFPLNKNLWTSSYVLVSAGWTMVVFSILMVVVDGWGKKSWAFPALVFGANSITAYALAGMLTAFTHGNWFGGTSLVDACMAGLTAGGLPIKLASLLCALAYTGLVFVPIWLLYRRRIFIRL